MRSIDLYSAAINTQRPLAEVIAKESPQFVALEDEILKVARRFAERKAQMNAMDFDDLLLNWKRLLVEVPAARDSVTKRFSAVLVDEYQDTNRLQGEIVDAMAAAHGNLLVVGDDAQSIYGFRGAHFENILKFPERYPDCQQFRLLTNYRSTPPILALANASIACNRKQFQKELRPHREGGVLPALVPLRDVHQQAEFVAQRILELREEGIPLRRDGGALPGAYAFDGAADGAGAAGDSLPSPRRGAVLRAGAHQGRARAPQVHPEPARRAVVQADRQAGAGDRSRERRCAVGPGRAVAPAGSRGAHAAGVARRSWCRRKRAPGLRTLGAALQTLVAMRSQPSEMIRCILHEGGYGEALKQRYANAQARADDVLQLADYALQAESLEQLLTDLTLLDSLEAEDVVEGAEPDEKLTLSSVHQAKGLEWRAVFLIWLADGRFPSAPALRAPDGEEEERRLFYVAVTRAKDELYLTYPILQEERDQARLLLRPSRFVDELPVQPAPYEKWSIEVAPEAKLLEE